MLMSTQTAPPAIPDKDVSPTPVVERNPLFSAEMPVSYDMAGNVASRYGDPTWDLRSAGSDGATSHTLHFFCADRPQASQLDFLIRSQQKALIWLHMDAGKRRSLTTLSQTNWTLNFWCTVASTRGVDLYTLLSDPKCVAECSQDLNRTYLSHSSSVLKTLWRHREELGAPAVIQLQTLQEVLSAELQRRPKSKQTPLIPSRVYCTILGALDDRMTLIERELDLLLDAYEEDRVASRDAPANSTQRTAYRAKAMLHVVEHMRTLGYDTEQGARISDFIALRLGAHQMALIVTVAAYTGMRKGELMMLPKDGVLTEFEHLGCKHFEVHGATSKLNKGIKGPAVWITSHQGARAVRLAQRIALRVERLRTQTAAPGQKALLFPTLANPYKKLSSESFNNNLKQLREALCPAIEQSDVEELDRLELARNWARDDILVGQYWPLALHQLRRSLAVYAHRSGMVSLPALKAQLQHITQEMTLYYSGGFSRAVNLIFDKDHFSHEWEAAKTESSYFAYAFAVLFSDEDLFGQGVARLANAVERRSREETLLLFQKGKVAFQETPLGGCVSTEECKVRSLEPIPYDCLESNCVNMVVFGKRLEHIIKHQKMTVTRLAKDESGSVEHRLEALHLEVLLKAHKRLKKGAA